MKNRQLMRLNKVLHKGEARTVDCISPGNVSFLEDRHGEDKWGKWIDLDDVEFIPLTEEWLLMFGFVKDEEGWIYIEIKDNSFGMNYENNKWNFYWFHNVPLDHVHQLQNLYFALVGEELVIKDGI